jgi:hypothetical protein
MAYVFQKLGDMLSPQGQGQQQQQQYGGGAGGGTIQKNVGVVSPSQGGSDQKPVSQFTESKSPTGAQEAILGQNKDQTQTANLALNPVQQQSQNIQKDISQQGEQYKKNAQDVSSVPKFNVADVQNITNQSNFQNLQNLLGYKPEKNTAFQPTTNTNLNAQNLITRNYGAELQKQIGGAYNPGMSRLDQALLQSSPQANAQIQQGLGKEQSAIQGLIGGYQAAGAQGDAARQAEATRQQNLARQALGQQLQTVKGQEQQAGQEFTKTSQAAAEKRERDILTNMGIPAEKQQDVINNLKGKYSLDINETAGYSPEQVNQFNALATLLGTGEKQQGGGVSGGLNEVSFQNAANEYLAANPNAKVSVPTTPYFPTVSNAPGSTAGSISSPIGANTNLPKIPSVSDLL